MTQAAQKVRDHRERMRAERLDSCRDLTALARFLTTEEPLLTSNARINTLQWEHNLVPNLGKTHYQYWTGCDEFQSFVGKLNKTSNDFSVITEDVMVDHIGSSQVSYTSLFEPFTGNPMQKTQYMLYNNYTAQSNH